MPAGSLVRPQKWSRVIDLYDDGTNSAIWGSFEWAEDRCLGVRYNEDYPNQGGNSLWYVEPRFVTKNILLELLSRVNLNASYGHANNILLALREHEQR
jgi:hypothetical protein